MVSHLKVKVRLLKAREYLNSSIEIVFQQVEIVCVLTLPTARTRKNRLLTVPACLFYDTLMHKTDLIKHLAKKNRRSQEHYQTALNEILADIQQRLSQGKEVVLTDFGTFCDRYQQNEPLAGLQRKSLASPSSCFSA